jgi:hypothetical protein
MIEVLVSAGIPYETWRILECRDVHEMALVIARANQWAKGERTLIAELPDRPLPTPSWLSVHRERVGISALLFTFALCLFAVWQLA